MNRAVLFILISLWLVSGCISLSPEKERSAAPSPAQQYIAKGVALEQQDSLPKALEQYELALTVEPDNKLAADHKSRVVTELQDRARQHYENGLAFDEQGKYEAARKEYLAALQNWPDHKLAREKLSPGGVTKESSDYIVHELGPGESVSKLGLIYYGDLKAYPIIGKFNNMKDVTRVRIGDKLKIPATEAFPLASLQQKQQAYLDSKRAEKKLSGQPDTARTEYEQPLTEEKTAAPESEETQEEPAPEEKQAEPEPEAIPDIASKAPVSPAAPVSYDKALALFNKKKYAQAIPLLEAAQTEAPDNEAIKDQLFKSHFQLGLSRYDAEKYLAAKSSFESALSQNADCDKCPDYIKKCEDTFKEKHYNLGIHYFGKEQLEKAINEWTKVHQIDPGYKEVSANLKKAQMLHERLESIKKGSAQ
ncbi:MAG: tetratricopeptide repeat protein [Desulfobacter sp.]|nr:MAG: tetratricopeptide repeat protein [Desulfobacter sp.]